MSNDSTRAPRLGAAADAIALLQQYAVHFPELSQPHINLTRRTFPVRSTMVELMVDIDDFEPWREALGFGTDMVRVYQVISTSNIEASGIVSVGVEDRVVEVAVHLYATGLLTQERPTAEVVSS